MKRFLRRFAAFMFVAAIVAALIYAFQPQPIIVDVDVVTRGPMMVTIDEEGETRLRERFVVSTPVAGRVLRIDLEPGDRVSAGQTPIATFRPVEPGFLDTRTRAETEARLQAAQAGIGRTRANRERLREELNFSESRRARDRELFDQGLISRERFDAAQFEARAAREALNAAEFEVGDAEQAVMVAQASLVQITDDTAADGSGNPITIRSPIDGVVLRRMRESEAVVPAGEPLVELGDTRRIEIVSDLLSEDAVRVRPGHRVLIEQWGGGLTLEGRVRLVEPSGFTKLSALGVEEQRVNVVVDFNDPALTAEYLGDGYRVEIRVVTWETSDTLKIPTGSLFRTGDDWTVFVVSGGLAERRTIEVSRRNALEAEVLSGLAESEIVIVYPGQEVSDGVEVVSLGTN